MEKMLETNQRLLYNCGFIKACTRSGLNQVNSPHKKKKKTIPTYYKQSINQTNWTVSLIQMSKLTSSLVEKIKQLK